MAKLTLIFILGFIAVCAVSAGRIVRDAPAPVDPLLNLQKMLDSPEMRDQVQQLVSVLGKEFKTLQDAAEKFIEQARSNVKQET